MSAEQIAFGLVIVCPIFFCGVAVGRLWRRAGVIDGDAKEQYAIGYREGYERCQMDERNERRREQRAAKKRTKTDET